jgi:hypothetical protein
MIFLAAEYAEYVDFTLIFSAKSKSAWYQRILRTRRLKSSNPNTETKIPLSIFN